VQFSVGIVINNLKLYGKNQTGLGCPVFAEVSGNRWLDGEGAVVPQRLFGHFEVNATRCKKNENQKAKKGAVEGKLVYQERLKKCQLRSINLKFRSMLL
jgi:hypothetical protein